MFLKSLTLSNILSFGLEPHTVELGPLNVIIGPNGSGKSNFIEAIGLLKAAPKDIRKPIREGGGIYEWIWKGSERYSDASIEAEFVRPEGRELRYRCEIREVATNTMVLEEQIYSLSTPIECLPIIVKIGNISVADKVDFLDKLLSEYDHERSIFSQLRHPFASQAVYFLGGLLKNIEIHCEIPTGKGASARLPQKTDLPNASLADDASNLGLILNRIKRDADARQNLKDAIQELYENIDDVDVEGGTVQVFVYEGRMAVPATRLSSGTLRFLCLLAILLHPEPPPLICIEEPELGLHPDLIPTISRLLKEAAERTQIIVTTHSDILVDTMTDRPEAVLVAEKGEGGTRLTRLDPERLKPWLEKYRLGDLWTRGDIGGTRW